MHASCVMRSGLLCIWFTSLVTGSALPVKTAALLWCALHRPMETDRFHKLLIPKAFSGRSQVKKKNIYIQFKGML